MQRVRIGLTGLAFVFLAVLLAAVFTRNPSREAPITPNLIEQQKAGRRRRRRRPRPGRPSRPSRSPNWASRLAMPTTIAQRRQRPPRPAESPAMHRLIHRLVNGTKNEQSNGFGPRLLPYLPVLALLAA
jgi:hypothetical protein